MLQNITTFRVRYGETDQMGIVNNAVYASWFEVGRTEMFCELKFPYSEMEKRGLLLPLAELNVRYHSPAYYEDMLTITTTIDEMPAAKIRINYSISNQKGNLVATGYTIQAFVDAQTRRPMRIPGFLKDILSQSGVL